MRQVGEDVRFRSWTWLAVFLLIGFALGGATGYYFFVQDMNRMSERLDAIQQQISLVPAPDAKPVDGKAGKSRHLPRSSRHLPSCLRRHEVHVRHGRLPQLRHLQSHHDMQWFLLPMHVLRKHRRMFVTIFT